MDILTNIDNPRLLEKLYRDNKAAFKAEFNALYPKIADNKLASYWHERLNYESPEISLGSNKDLFRVIAAAFLAGGIAKLPQILGIEPDLFYQRNVGFIVFPILAAYFFWKNGLPIKKMAIAAVVFLISLFWINYLPADTTSDTLLLSCIHLPLLLWAVLGFSYVGNDLQRSSKRLEYLRYNGDLIIMCGLLLIAGILLSAVTFALFKAIGVDIELVFTEYIAVFGLAAIPIVGTYITQINPHLVDKVSPVIAKVFSPLVLITLITYLVVILLSGKNPYEDREFLMVFNLLLIGVMAIILFSVAETSRRNDNRTGSIILFALSIVTIVVNAIALSAILFRIADGGFTPNRLAVMGGNILILVNLLMVTFRLFKHISKMEDLGGVEQSIAKFLPVYVLWTTVVVFIFPLIFNFN